MEPNKVAHYLLQFFLLAIELLAVAISSNTNIKCIKIGQTEHTLGLFAGDIMLSLSNPVASLNEVQQILDFFGKVSYYIPIIRLIILNAMLYQ